MADWYWHCEENCWQLIQRWDRWYPKNHYRKWAVGNIVLSVAGRPDVYDAGLLARASWYATQIDQLEAIARDYLSNRPIKVYGGYEDPSMFATIVHPPRPPLEIDEIKIPTVSHPERVHVIVDTCYPDPYFFYELIFEAMEVVDALGGFR